MERNYTAAIIDVELNGRGGFFEDEDFFASLGLQRSPEENNV